MATEVLSGAVALGNGVAHNLTDVSGKAPHNVEPSEHPVANGIAENGHLEDDDDAGNPAPSKSALNGDINSNHVEDARADPPPGTEAGIGVQGLLGPAPPKLEEVAAFGEAPLAAHAQAAAEKAPVEHKFWLVRVPRPDLSAENNKIKILQMAIAEKKEKASFIAAAFRLKQAARSEAQAALRAARDRARACSAEVRKKFDEAKPLQDMLKRLNEGRKDARAQGRGLEATSEAELNGLIKHKEHRLLHESITLNEEKQLMKEIKQLEASRPKVREIEALNVSVNESLGQKEALQAQLKPLLAEVELLKEERDAAQEILKTFEDEAMVCEEAVQQLLGERDAARLEQDAVYDELRALRAEAYRKEEDFRQYRRDLMAAQEMAVAKDVAALETFAHEQRERIHAKLNKDAAYRKAYFAANQWSTIRRFGTLDTRRLGIDEDPATVLDVSSGDAGTRGGAAVPGGRGGAVQAKVLQEGREAQSHGLKSEGATKGATAKKPVEKKAAGVAEGAPKAAGGAKAKGPQELSDIAGVVPSSSAPAPAALSSEEAEAEKEKRRQEALLKAKEAEERKRKQAERAQQRAESRAAKEAEEAAKRREKEKERKARRKATAAADKAAAAEAAAAQAAENGEEVPGTEAPDGKEEESRKLGKTPSDSLTKRQRKRMAAGKGKGGDGDQVAVQKKTKKGQAGAGFLVYVAAVVAVLVIIALLFLVGKVFLERKPVFSK